MHEISEIDGLKFLYNEYVKPTILLVPLSAILVLGSAVGIGLLNERITEYCKDGCKLQLGKVEIIYQPKAAQKVLDRDT